METKAGYDLFDDSFRKLYSSLGLISDDGKFKELHRSCLNSANCWKGAEGRYPNGWSEISRPWVGKKYSEQAPGVRSKGRVAGNP